MFSSSYQVAPKFPIYFCTLFLQLDSTIFDLAFEIFQISYFVEVFSFWFFIINLNLFIVLLLPLSLKRRLFLLSDIDFRYSCLKRKKTFYLGTHQSKHTNYKLFSVDLSNWMLFLLVSFLFIDVAQNVDFPLVIDKVIFYSQSCRSVGFYTQYDRHSKINKVDKSAIVTL